VIPFVTQTTGLIVILIIGAATAIGQALSAPTLSSLASKSASAGEQGSVLGVMQSVASLARAVGPTLAAILIHSAVNHIGFDGLPQKMSDASIARTFWTAAAIQFVAFLIAVHFARAKREFAAGDIAEAG
jgi:DHA1 family tetracycline resistance protein-like MFS transporter